MVSGYLPENKSCVGYNTMATHAHTFNYLNIQVLTGDATKFIEFELEQYIGHKTLFMSLFALNSYHVRATTLPGAKQVHWHLRLGGASDPECQPSPNGLHSSAIHSADFPSIVSHIARLSQHAARTE